MLPKVIFIDWHKTLSNSVFWEQLGDEKHSHHQLYPIIFNWLFVENKDIINPWMRGQYTSEEICGQMAKAIEFDNNIILEELIQSCKNMKFISNDIPDLIRKLRKKGTKIVIATDNMDTFHRFTVVGLNLNDLFDDFLNSWKIKRLKADFGENGKLLFFEKYIRLNNLDYKDAVLIDDHADDSGIMQKAGLRTIQVTEENPTVKILKSFTL